MRNIWLLLEIFPSLPAHWYLYLWNFYPPYFGAGIRIHHIAPDFSSVRTSLRLRWWNKNIIGTLFGGSLYSMCDPIHMVMLSNLLGPSYVVRDKGAEVRFLRKGTTSAHVLFEISTRTVAEIWNDPSEVQERKFSAQVRDAGGEVIAEVVKVLHIRRKGAATK